MKAVMESKDPGQLYAGWAKLFGGVYSIPGPLFTQLTVVCDPKAIAHICGVDSWKYRQPTLAEVLLEQIVRGFVQFHRSEDIHPL